MSVTKRSYRSYDAAFKLIVLKRLQIELLPGNLGWMNIEEESGGNGLEDLSSKKKRLEGGGRKAASPETEEEVLAWIEGFREKNLWVS